MMSRGRQLVKLSLMMTAQKHKPPDDSGSESEHSVDYDEDRDKDYVPGKYSESSSDEAEKPQIRKRKAKRVRTCKQVNEQYKTNENRFQKESRGKTHKSCLSERKRHESNRIGREQDNIRRQINAEHEVNVLHVINVAETREDEVVVESETMQETQHDVDGDRQTEMNMDIYYDNEVEVVTEDRNGLHNEVQTEDETGAKNKTQTDSQTEQEAERHIGIESEPDESNERQQNDRQDVGNLVSNETETQERNERENDNDDEEKQRGTEKELQTENNPTQRKRARKGQGDPSNWIRNKEKKKRMKGESFKGYRKTAAGQYVQDANRKARQLGPACTKGACRKAGGAKHCSLFSEEERSTILSHFWNDLNWDQRKTYVSSLVYKADPERRNQDIDASRKQVSFVYHLRKDDKCYRVCKEMFLATFCIGEWSVRNWVLKASMGMQPLSPSRTQVTSDKRLHLQQFLQSLPKVPSHYCRSSSSRNYLEPQIKTYNDLHKIYRDWCAENSYEPLSHQTLRLECNDLDIGLYHPKKDQCDTCLGHEAGNVSDEVYALHIQRKEAARTAKSADKERAQADKDAREEGKPGYHVLTMDLQSLLLSPSLNASCMYYKTKLSCHNFTIYNNCSREVICYFWHEGQGELSSHVFASCITDFVSSLASPGDTVIIWSDGCTYQNRNVTLSNALLHLSTTKGITVEQKYLERGHTQMEVDSVHSVIERALKHRAIYTPADYVDAMKQARKTQPYEVKYLNYTFFKDFSGINYYQSIRPGNKVGDPQVTNLKALRYTPDGQLLFKLDIEDEWPPLPRRPRREAESQGPVALYTEPRKIKTSKYKHLQEIKSVIPSDYHSFYDLLPHTT